jgi:hypothetical protein
MLPKTGWVVWVTGEDLRRHNPFKIDAKWSLVVAQLYGVPGAVRTKTGTFYVPLSGLSDGSSWTRFFGIVDSVIDEVRRAAERGLK